MAIEHTIVARSYKGGIAYAAPVGTGVPTGVVWPLDPAVAAGHLGTLAQDGLTIDEKRESETIPDFDGNDYITFQKKYSVEIVFKLLDVDKEQVLELLHGAANVVHTSATAAHGNLVTVNHTGEQLPLLEFTFTTVSHDGKVRFDTVELGRVAETADFKLESQDASGVKVTIKASKDGEGRLFRTHTDDKKVVPGPVVSHVVATGAWRFGVGGNLSAPLTATSTNAEVKTAVENIYGVTGTVTVAGSTTGTFDITLADGGVVSVQGAATLT